MELPASGHEPVMPERVLEGLGVREGMTIVDATLGRAGHARLIAERLGGRGRLIGLELDPNNLRFARTRLAEVPCRVDYVNANFAELTRVLRDLGVERVEGILADLGVSTNQLLDPGYGLGFSQDGPLDMRLDPGLDRSAADLVNHLPEREIADVLYSLAQERFSRRIARKIVEARRVAPIKETSRLAEIVRSAVPTRSGAPDRIDPATRTFMALRMAVNHEIPNLRRLLDDAWKTLAAAGRLVVISFHSGEDRLVKHAFRQLHQQGLGRIITPKPLTPDESELVRNPRSRSSKLRVFERMI